jgi:chromosome segregation ATPase
VIEQIAAKLICRPFGRRINRTTIFSERTTVSTQTTSRCRRLGEVLGSLGDLTGHAAEFEHFVGTTLGAISDWHEEMDQREALIRDREKAISSESERLEQIAAGQAATRAELDAAGIQTDNKRRLLESEAQQNSEEVAQQFESLHQQQRELEATTEQLTSEREQLEQERDQLRQQLAEATAEATQLRKQTVATLNGEGAAPQRVVELEQERQALEEELELVRQRAAELVESADEERRGFESQRTLWAKDMKELRRSLQVNAPASPQPAPIVTRPAAVQTAAIGPNGRPRDTALDSVMAQFEMLQRDLAQRGTNKARKSTPRQQEVA